jgi:hypothetical protein
MKIQQTTSYEIFEMHEFNRDVHKIKDLEKSMRTHGYIPAYPLHVQKNGGGKLKVKAGHHRLFVAKKLGIPVYYVICDDLATIHELEKSTNTWSMSDYLASWCRVGKEDYIEVRNYCTRTGISLSIAASMFYGNQAGTGNHSDSFKSGSFKIKDRKQANAVADIVEHMKNCGVECYNAQLLVKSISRVLYVPEFDVETFKLKIRSHTHMITKQVNEQEYMNMIEAVYNRQNKEKIPLSFLADTLAKARNVAPLRNNKTTEPAYLPAKLKHRRAVNE